MGIFGEDDKFEESGFRQNDLLSDVGIKLPEGSVKMDMQYKGSHSLFIYAACTSRDIEDLANKRIDISYIKFHESRNNADILTNGPQKPDKIISTVLDTSSCLDLTNAFDFVQLKNFCKQGAKLKIFNKDTSKDEVLSKFIKSSNGKYKSIRYISDVGYKLSDKVCKDIVFRCIMYKIYDTRAINGLHVIK